MSTDTIFNLLGGVVGAIVLLIFLVRRRREHQRAVHYLEEAVKQELHIPASLHPVIDPDLCIGSGSCITACPEGEILGLIDGVATLLKGSKCIGHGRCASECPVDAIKLVFGSAERGMDLPEVDEFFESAKKGIHIVGELAGMGLIKNALMQGLQVSAHFKKSMKNVAKGKVIDVVIVGAGPAGIATAVGCKAAGLSFRILEQENTGGTVANYPRQKLVMTDVVKMPFYGKFGQPQIRKEALVQMFHDMLTKAEVKVETGVKVNSISGEIDNFKLNTSRGEVAGRRVVLAIGRGGTPRKIGVPGEDLPKVTYRLIDPEQFNGKRVVVVGGGDSALESAIMLGNESDAEVTISYRKPEFGRCRPLNKERIADVIKRGRVTAMMASEITLITEGAVELKTGAERKTIPNDFIIANLGGELPTDFLKAAGVSIKRHDGTQAMANPAMAGRKR